jgi:hypothetical protein
MTVSIRLTQQCFLLKLYIPLCILSGCSGYQYQSTPNYIPMNYSKGECKADFYLNSIQLGYSISNHVSVFTTAYWDQTIRIIDWQAIASKENGGAEYFNDSFFTIDIGVSYFSHYKDFIFEVLAGGGFGKASYSHRIDLWPDYSSNFNARTTDLFIQPNFGYKLGKIVTIGFFARYTINHYYNIQSVLYQGGHNKIEPVDKTFYQFKTKDICIIDPGIFCKIGYKNMVCQIIISHGYNQSDNNLLYKKTNFFLSFSFSPTDLIKSYQKHRSTKKDL